MQTKQEKNLIIVSVMFVLVVILLSVSRGDYEEEKEIETNYCDMVKNGYWPNYKNLTCEKTK